MSASKYIVNVEVAIYQNDKWLLVRRSLKERHAPGELSLVGGKVEQIQVQHSVLEETLWREIREEVGIEVYSNMQYVKSSLFITDDGQCVVDVVFLCQFASGEAQALDPHELSSVEWFTYAEIEQHPEIKPWTKESLLKADKLRVIGGTGDFRL